MKYRRTLAENEEIVVYLIDYKSLGNGYYSYAYLDFRTEKDLIRFVQVSQLPLNTKSVLFIENFYAGKRLRRESYYALNYRQLIDRQHFEVAPMDDSTVVAYDFQRTQERKEQSPLLDSHSQLNGEEIIFSNSAEKLPQLGKSPNLKLRANNVGQGNCNEILQGGDVKIVYDLGASIHAKKTELRNLINNRIKAFQKSRPLLIISHWDMDHYKQLKGMTDGELAYFSHIICSAKQPSVNIQRLYQKLVSIIGVQNVESVTPPSKPKKGHPHMTMHKSMGILTIFKGENSGSKNYSGIAALVQGNKGWAVLSGDSSYYQVSQILQAMNSPAQSILRLIVPHHGGEFTRNLSTLTLPPSLLAESAIISVDEQNNTYGHPKRSVIGKLQSQFMEVLRTDKIGDIERDF